MKPYYEHAGITMTREQAIEELTAEDLLWIPDGRAQSIYELQELREMNEEMIAFRMHRTAVYIPDGGK